jgi:hypothetical protein
MRLPPPSRFFYFSDDKLRRLSEEFPPPWWRRLLDQITFLTIFMVSVGRKRSETTRMQKLRWVQRRLEGLGKIGSVDEPREYFFGRLMMHYDAFDMVSPPTMYLVGETDKTIVALGGSLSHVPGREDIKPREGATDPVRGSVRPRSPPSSG